MFFSMPRIILSIIVIVAIIAWVVSIALQKQKNVVVQNLTPRERKSYVSPDVLLQGVEKITITHEKIVDLKAAIHEQIVGMDGFINAIIITLLARGHALVE